MIELNGNRIEFTNFPNNESKMVLDDHLMDALSQAPMIQWMWRYESDAEVFHLLAIKRHLENDSRTSKVRMTLFLPYMPYSRMDRKEGTAIFTLKVLSEIINGMAFSEVLVLEAHSDVSLALIERVREIPTTSQMTRALLNQLEKKHGSEKLYLVYPDAGAFKRYGKTLRYERDIHAVKVRDFETGMITKMTLNQAPEQSGFIAIIMDDLVSKGWTFKFIIDALRERGASEVHLVVTHCENAIMDGELIHDPLLKGVYATNSIFNAPKPDILTLVDVNKIINQEEDFL